MHPHALPPPALLQRMLPPTPTSPTRTAPCWHPSSLPACSCTPVWRLIPSSLRPCLSLLCVVPPPPPPHTHSIRARFEKVIREAQDSICAAISEIDGKPFHQDAWTREDGGGGITRVLVVSGCWLLLLCCWLLGADGEGSHLV